MRRTFIRAIFLCTLFSTGVNSLFAQSNEENSFYRHEVSLQANRIIQEIIGLDGNATANPYVFRYAYRLTERDVLNMAAGAFFSDNSDAEQDIDLSTRSHLDFRIGYQRRLDLGHGAKLGLGWDIVTRRHRDEYTQYLGGAPDSTVYNNSLEQNTYGTGPRLTFSYQITPRFSIGTEVSFYYHFLRESSNSKSSRTFSLRNGEYEQVNYESDSQEYTGSAFNFTVPSGVFLILHL